jgi:hypothetical protein
MRTHRLAATNLFPLIHAQTLHNAVRFVACAVWSVLLLVQASRAAVFSTFLTTRATLSSPFLPVTIRHFPAFYGGWQDSFTVNKVPPQQKSPAAAVSSETGIAKQGMTRYF